MLSITNNIMTKQQRLCVLPFTHQGRVYYGCAPKNSTEMLGDNGWCATAVNEKGEVSETGDCPLMTDASDEDILIMAEECEEDTTSSVMTSVVPDTRSGQMWVGGGDSYGTRCIVPFVFENSTYWDCTRAGTTEDEDAWCAVEVDELRNVVRREKCSPGRYTKESSDVKHVAWDKDWLLDMRDALLGFGNLRSSGDEEVQRIDTVSGKECVFPFKLPSTKQSHSSCVCPTGSCEGTNRPVCATEVDELGYMTASEPCRGILIRKENFFDQLIST
ncbi:uncharacterized protein LOC108675362 [Hyalella azteca]|uniref:Uncharacterized protein LOC108675362 n=1 Tax=Hyalella azteca TaxID=294128 RepID=A0A979FKW6_HYAAZ|nr:uncharacterized protein LOC108675362 [Hyalella azteca]